MKAILILSWVGAAAASDDIAIHMNSVSAYLGFKDRSPSIDAQDRTTRQRAAGNIEWKRSRRGHGRGRHLISYLHMRRALKLLADRVECNHGCHLLRCSVLILVG